jgi:hypothetical protein
MPKIPSKLVLESDGSQIKVGDSVTTFRGEECTVTDWMAPTHPGSTGRVYVKFADGREMEYFPGVVGTRIEIL